jgi:hypothetical protein
MSKQRAYSLIPHDWSQLERLINQLGNNVLTSNSSLSDIEASITSVDTSKIDRVLGATAGNFAGLTAGGSLIDSGYNVDDFELALTKGDLTAGSSKITIGGTGTDALIGVGATVDVVENQVNHNSLLNTHNLTTDIDHNALTNYVANEHIDWTNATQDLLTTGGGRFDGGIGIGISPGGGYQINILKTFDPSLTLFVNGLNFDIRVGAGSDNLMNVYGASGLANIVNNSGYTGTIDKMAGFVSRVYVGGNGVGSDPTITSAYLFYGLSLLKGAGPFAANLLNAYGLYLPEITAGSVSNYAIYSAGGQSVHAGKVRFGGTLSPTEALDVTGNGLISGTLGVTGAITGPNVSSGENPGHTHTTTSIEGVPTVYNVLDYGAVGDSDGTTGDGTDDVDAIQAAIDDIGAGGGILWIPAGYIFRCTDGLAIETNNIIIDGGGHLYFDCNTFTAVYGQTAGIVVKNSDATVAAMNGSTTLNRGGTIGENFTMQNITITSNGGNAETFAGTHQVMDVYNWNNVNIIKCNISGFNSNAIAFYGVFEGKVLNCTFNDIRFACIHGFINSHLVISNNIMDTVYFGIQCPGLYTQITGNTIMNVGGASIAGGTPVGIYVAMSSYYEPMHIVISNNFVHSIQTSPLCSGISINKEAALGADSFCKSVNLVNNTITGTFSYAIRIQQPPSPDGTQTISNNLIICENSVNTESAIYVHWDSDGYGGNEWTNILNNTIVHLDGYMNLSIDVSGASLTEPPRVRVMDNNIETHATLRAAKSLQIIGDCIYVPYISPDKTVCRGNIRDGHTIGRKMVLGATGAGVGVGTTAGKARTNATVRIQADWYVTTKASTNDLFDLTGVSTGAGEYKKVLLCITTPGSGVIVEGEIATTQLNARIPEVGVRYNYVPVGVVEIPQNYSGGSLAGYTFYDILGEWINK